MKNHSILNRLVAADMKRKAGALVLAAAALAIGSASQPASAQNGSGLVAPIEGSWIFNIDVSLDQQPVATFNSLISFAGGGVVVTSPSTSPLAIFYGAWSPMKPSSFSAVFYTFAPDSTGTGVVNAEG